MKGLAGDSGQPFFYDVTIYYQNVKLNFAF